MKNKKAPQSNIELKKAQHTQAWRSSLRYWAPLVWLKWIASLVLILIILLGFYALYLNQKIISLVSKSIWQLPATIYSRTVDLEPNMAFSLSKMVKLLQSMQYRHVEKIVRSGEFIVKDNYIELFRRSFTFADGKEEAILVRLSFSDLKLTTIRNLHNNREFGFFRLDPKLITMIQSLDIAQNQATLESNKHRIVMPLKEIPQSFIDMLLAMEDRNFYQHDGVSFIAIGRAFLANFMAGKRVQGGSTITQQLIKNLLLSNEKTLSRKLNEIILALLFELKHSKEDTLALYLNEVYLGQIGNTEIRGFALASLYYFGRFLNELSLDQQAMLIGLVPAPSLYNPWRNPAVSLKRRNLVLQVMKQQGLIEPALFETLIGRPLDVKARGDVLRPQHAFIELVQHTLKQNIPQSRSNLSGAKIFTTMDPLAQEAAEKAIEFGIKKLKTAHKLTDLEAATVIVDRFSGEVRALIGGSQPQFPGFNRALHAQRSIGSLVKPFIYLAALSQPNQYRLNTILPDQPISVDLPNGKSWEPQNYDRRYRQYVTLFRGLTASLNIPTVNLGMEVGLDVIAEMLERVGIPQKSISLLPATLLGAVNLTPIQLAQAYQTLASGGNLAPLSAVHTVINENSDILYRNFSQATRVISIQAAYLTLYTMQKSVSHGTAQRLNRAFSQYDLAGKTGTTNLLRDSWFVGIDDREVSLFWVGHDDNRPGKLTGATGGLEIYIDFLKNSTPLPLKLQIPEEIVEMPISNAEEATFICDVSDELDQKIVKIPVWTEEPEQICRQQQHVVKAANETVNINLIQKNDNGLEFDQTVE